MSSSKPHVTRPTLMLVAACLAAFTTPVPASVAFAGPATERIPEAAADREEPADPTAPLAAGAPETAPGLATLRAQQTEARGKLIAAQVRVRTAERTAEEADRLLAHADRARDQAAATLERARRNLTGLAVATYKTTRATGLPATPLGRRPAGQRRPDEPAKKPEPSWRKRRRRRKRRRKPWKPPPRYWRGKPPTGRAPRPTGNRTRPRPGPSRRRCC